jgi:hypothetical protein
MTAAYLAWAAELLLECAGAYCNLKRSKLLSLILILCAISDMATFLVFQFFSRTVYAWSYWGAHALKGLLLIWLGCSICGMFVAERDKIKTVFMSGFVSVASISFVMFAFFRGDSLKDRLLDAEIVASMILLGMIALGWLGRSSYLSPAWKIITAGFVLMVGSDLIFTVLWSFWDGARHWYPIGTIAALGVWVAGPLMPHKLKDCRLSLGRKIVEAERVSVC